MFHLSKQGHKHKGRIIQKWVFEARSPLLSGAIAVDIDGDGKKEVLFGTKDGTLYCIGENSAERWHYDVRAKRDKTEAFFYDSERIDAVPSTPTVADVNDDGKLEVLFGTEQGMLYCLTSEGKLLWKYDAKGALRGRIVADDVDNDGSCEVFFGTNAGTFVILDANGKARHVLRVQSPIEGVPAVIKSGKTQILFGSEDGTLYSYNPLGKLQWTFKGVGGFRAEPVLADLDGLRIVIGDVSGVVYALSLKGRERWRFRTAGAIYSRVAVGDVNGDGELEVVVGSCDNKVYCLDARGERLWSYETDFWIVAPPILLDIDDDGMLEVVVGSYDHNLYVLDGVGTYALDYMPGLAGVAQQAGSYTNVLTKEAGAQVGKRLWQLKTQGMIVGCEELDPENIIVNVKTGFVDEISHSNT